MKKFIYKPKCEQEEKDFEFIKNYEKIFDNLYLRENKICHFTSSAFIVNEKFNKVLCVYHNIYDSWTWVGGHADGDHNLLAVAPKETQEETGLKLEQIKILNNQPISLDILPVLSHKRKGEFVSAHVHFNVLYLFQTNEKFKTRILEDENSGVEWLTFDKLLKLSKEPHMIPAYKKVFDYIKKKYKN